MTTTSDDGMIGVMGGEPSPLTEQSPVLPWRLVVGALLHLIVPAYLLVLLAAWLAEGASTHGLLGGAMVVSGCFFAGYALLTLLAALLARAVDPVLTRRRARREAGDPALAARRSATRVADATARATRLAGGAMGEPVATAVARLRHATWDHTDEHDQRLSADLARAVEAFTRAHASAARDDKPAVAALAATALDRIASALDELVDERRRLDHGDALTQARYLDSRYGPALDSSGTGSGPGVAPGSGV